MSICRETKKLRKLKAAREAYWKIIRGGKNQVLKIWTAQETKGNPEVTIGWSLTPLAKTYFREMRELLNQAVILICVCQNGKEVIGSRRMVPIDQLDTTIKLKLAGKHEILVFVLLSHCGKFKSVKPIALAEKVLLPKTRQGYDIPLGRLIEYMDHERHINISNSVVYLGSIQTLNYTEVSATVSESYLVPSAFKQHVLKVAWVLLYTLWLAICTSRWLVWSLLKISVNWVKCWSGYQSITNKLRAWQTKRELVEREKERLELEHFKRAEEARLGKVLKSLSEE